MNNTFPADNDYASDDGRLIIVLSRSYSTGLSVARSLGKAGYTVDMVASSYKAGANETASYSSFIRRYREVVTPKADDGHDEALLSVLLAYAEEAKTKKIVLFPTDDYTASVMDTNRSALEPYFLMPHIVGGGDSSMTAMMDKSVQSRLASAAGLNVPAEWVITLEEELTIPEEISYPCFCKPVASIAGFKTEMARCDNRSQLRRHLRELRKKHPGSSVLVQEFLYIDREIDFSGVCLDQQVIVPAIVRKTHVAQYEKGVTMAGYLAPFEELGEEARKIVDMLREFHYVGMFDMELIVADDKLYFNEVNLRSGGPNYSYFQSGVNLPGLVVKELLGEPHTPEEEQVKAYGKSFVYEKVAWEDFSHNMITRSEMDALIASADIHLLNDPDDPKPYQFFQKNIRKTVIRGKGKTALLKLRSVLRRGKQALVRFFGGIAKKVGPVLLGLPQTKRGTLPRGKGKKTVVVAGRNYCSNLSMAKALGKAGYRVEVVHVYNSSAKKALLSMLVNPFSDAYSKYVQAFHICVTRHNSNYIYAKLRKIANRKEKMLLIPTDDLVASVVDNKLKQLKRYYLIPNIKGKAGEINRLMSKSRQKRLAVEAGIPVVNGQLIRVTRRRGVNSFTIPEGVNYPCFIKPNVSMRSSKSKMQVCNSAEELEAALRDFSRKKSFSVMAEDLVDIAREYSILGVSTRDCAIGPGLFVAEIGGKEDRRGVAVTGRTLPSDALEPLTGKLVDFVGTLDFTGLYDIDLIEDTKGNIYFAEINLRFGASGYAFVESGLNLPGMFAEHMFTGRPLKKNVSNPMPDKTFVSERGLLEEYTNNTMTRKEVDEIIESCDICFIKDPDDPKPFRHFKRYFIPATLRRLKK